MFYVKKQFEISAAHRLDLNYESKCASYHGHNWIVTVECRSKELNENGMVTDFSIIKDIVIGKFDHTLLNDVFEENPTAENIAKWIVDHIPNCYRCEVKESEGNIAAYEKD